jgi:hypothetical protein
MCFDQENSPVETENPQDQTAENETPYQKEIIQRAIELFVKVATAPGRSAQSRLNAAVHTMDIIGPICSLTYITPEAWIAALQAQHPEMVIDHPEHGLQINPGFFKEE